MSENTSACPLLVSLPESAKMLRACVRTVYRLIERRVTATDQDQVSLIPANLSTSGVPREARITRNRKHTNMIAHVFKRRGARMYSGRYRLDGEKKITQVELGCSNRQVAEKKFGKIVEEKEREAAGIIAPKDQREAPRTPLVEHLDE